ncbi:MAG: nitroreductase family protein [Proteobacteria bacterium]|nr:nitroreductase family protein [Pseudomonadota bacterium]
MDVLTLIKERISIRHFLPEIPPRAVILECLEAASWAPNPTSQQPWKFIVLTGDTLKAVCRVIEDNFAEAAAKMASEPTPAVSGSVAKVLKERKDRSFGEMLSFLKEKNVDLKAIGRGNFIFHNAPMGILFATYPCKDQNFLKATIAAMQTFLLAATARGLGTCWMNAVSICQHYIKEALNLSPELILVDGVAVGYPVADSPLNQIPRHRLPVEEVTVFL